jgi:hypothetical protein
MKELGTLKNAVTAANREGSCERATPAFRCTLLLTVGVPIACQLSVFSVDERRRYQAARARIDAAVTRIVEMDTGYIFHLPGDDAMLALVADWIALERRCCQFFEFTISIGGSDQSIRVALTGGPEVKRFLESELQSHIVSLNAFVRRGAS